MGVGTDGSSSADNQNMFEAMRLAAFVSRVFDRPPEDWIGAAEALTLATEGSAAVLGMADLIGRIAPGYKADLVFLDLSHVNLVPLNNAAQQLVNTEDGVGGARRDDRRAVRVAGRRAGGDRLAGDRDPRAGCRGAAAGGERGDAGGGRAAGAGGQSFLYRYWGDARTICRAGCARTRPREGVNA